MREEFKQGQKVKWVDGAGFEAHGVVHDCVTHTMIEVKMADGKVLKVNRNILEYAIDMDLFSSNLYSQLNSQLRSQLDSQLRSQLDKGD